MQRSFRSILIASAVLGVPQLASASLLVGFHSFNDSANTDKASADFAIGGFSGTIVGTGPSVGAKTDPVGSGSSDNFYGDSTYKVNPVDSNNDGYIALNNGNRTFTLSLTNHTGAAYTLDEFLFDSVKTTSSGNLLADGLSVSSVSNVGTFMGGTQINGASYLQDYSDNIKGIGIDIANGETVSFVFTMLAHTRDMRFDNIGIGGSLTPVPEPGSLVALGCLVGSGAFLRTRRRSAAPQLG